MRPQPGEPDYVRYDLSLIDEVKADVEDFGGDTLVNVWCQPLSSGRVVYRNYNLIVEGSPVKPEAIPEGQYITQMSLSAFLALTELQNKEYWTGGFRKGKDEAYYERYKF